MKTKLLLTVLFSIGIIGITNAQGLAKSDRNPNRTEIVKTQHSGVQPQKEVRKHHHKRKAHRVVRKHRHNVRHQPAKHF